jgi:4-amino-4-deoxy-L-arabinose transferase-like glycosyltransferase
MASDKRLFLGSLGLAALVRGYLLWQYYCISSDGVVYLRTAREFFTGNFKVALTSVYPPGYPLLVAAIYPVVGDWELAGQLQSLIFGVGLLFPLYWTLRPLFSERVAVLACYLAAISPFLALYSAHVRSESSYLFFSVTALCLFIHGRLRRAKTCYFLGGVIAGIAYLIRPEAIGYLVIVPLVEAIRWLLDRDEKFLWILQTSGALCAGFALFALPYIVYLSIDTGRFGAVSRKAGVTLAINLKGAGLLDEEDIGQGGDVESLVFTDYIVKHPLLYLKKAAGDLLPAAGVFFAALHYSFVPFLILGLALSANQRMWHKPELLLIMVILVYVFGFALIYVKRRYSLQAVPVALAWVSLAIVYLWKRIGELLSMKYARTAIAGLALIVLGSTLPKTLKAVSREKSYVRETGRYLETLNGAGNLAVAVLDDRITFYARARTVLLTEVKSADVRSYLHQQNAEFLAAEAKTFAKVFPEVFRQPENYGLKFDREFVGTRNDRILLFKVM